MGATHSAAANERAGAQLWEAVETRDCAMLEQLLKAAPRCALHSRPHDQFSVLHQAASEWSNSNLSLPGTRRLCLLQHLLFPVCLSQRNPAACKAAAAVAARCSEVPAGLLPPPPGTSQNP